MSTTRDVIALALSQGFRWEYVGGELPVLSNHAALAASQSPNLLQAGPTIPLVSVVAFVPCGYCQQVFCLHGHHFGAMRKGQHVFCGIECQYQYQLTVKKARRRAGKEIG